MALSFIVTGTAWKWLLDPGVGLERSMHSLGWESFSFGWIKDSDMAIYCVVIAAVWQTTGFVMAMFLAGLRGVDTEQINAARVDGARTWQIYLRIIIPQLGPVFVSAFVILAHMAIKSYDLVIALTNGGPGRSTWLPSVFMYQYTFTRNEMAVGAASAVLMLVAIGAGRAALPVQRNAQGEDMANAQPRRRRMSRRRGTVAIAWPYRALRGARRPGAAVPDAGLRDGRQLVQAAGRDPQRQPDGAAAWTGRIEPWLSAWSTAQIGVQPTGLRAVLHQLVPAGRAGGGDLDADRRAQRLHPHPVPLPRRRTCCSPRCCSRCSFRSRSC